MGSADETEVLIIGAGPTGLAAACDALRHGMRVRVVERRASRAELSKALVVHARTMEVYEALGCADAVARLGQPFRALHVALDGREGRLQRRVDLLDRAWGDTAYPYWLSVPQYDVERALEARFAALGGVIEWGTALTHVEQDESTVYATLTRASGATSVCAAPWLLACDGGRSETRALAGIALERAGLGVTFALADVYTRGSLREDEGHAVLAREGVLLVVPMPEPRCWRLIAQVPAGFDAADLDAWRALLARRFGDDLGASRLGWNSRFDLTSGVAERYRNGRIFLLGDAAHVHSPVGGQGLNTGAQDAHALVWRLAHLRAHKVDPAARERLLASYERERRPTAKAMVRGTSIATRVLTLTHPTARALRARVGALALSSRRVQDRLARGVGMLDLRSDGQPRIENPLLADGTRLHTKLDPLRPTLLRYAGRVRLVRPDRVLAREGLIDPAHAVAVEVRS